MNAPVSIIGSGLAGLSAAAVLSRAGRDVKIVDRAPHLGGYKGQDFQVIRNYGEDLGFVDSLTKYGIDIKYKHPVSSIVKYAPSGKSMEVTSDNGPLFYVVKRGKSAISLDSQIYSAIDKKHATFEYNRNASIMTGDIIATGPIIRNLAGFGYTYEGIDLDADKIYFFMDNKYAPNGYIYVSPYGDGTASIASVSYDLNCNLKVFLDRFLENNPFMSKAVKSVTNTEVFSGYAYCNYPETAKVNDKLFIGAAAGFVEAARGFGVKYSILSGILAAQSMIEGSDYDKLWKDSFGKELLESISRHFLLSGLNNEGLERLVMGEKISVKNYKKVPSGLTDLYNQIKVQNELKKWRHQYNLKKMFEN